MTPYELLKEFDQASDEIYGCMNAARTAQVELMVGMLSGGG